MSLCKDLAQAHLHKERRIMENSLHSFIYCPRCGKEGFEDRGERAKFCPHCDLSYYGNVASAVACLIRNAKGEFLFVRRANEPAKGTLDMAGGFVDPMETVEEAVAREIKEETGLAVRQMTYIASLPNIYPYSGITVYTSDLFFLVELEDFDGAIASDDAEELVVLKAEELDAELFGLKSIKRFISLLKEGSIKL